MPKVFFRISKEGSVKLEGEGFQGDACERNPLLSRFIELIDEVDEVILKYQKQSQESELTVEVEDLF